MVAAGLEPLEPYPGSKLPWRSRCVTCDRMSNPRYSNVLQGSSCGWCTGHRVDPDEARAVMIAAGLKPQIPYPGSSVPWSCRCAVCERLVEPRYNEIRNGGGCAYCSRRRVDATEAEAVMIAAGLEPAVAYPGANVPWPCRCLTCNHHVEPTYNSVQVGKRCAYCSRRRVDPAEAHALMIGAGLEPLEPYPGALTRWRCRCLNCKGESTPTYSNVQDGHGCVWCAGLRVDARVATAVMIAAGMEPRVTFPGAKRPWVCRCVICKRESSPTLGSVQSGHGCVSCAGMRVDAHEATARMIAAGFEPLEPYKNSRSAWRCRCVTCERESAPSYGSIRDGGGCGWCAGMRVDAQEAAAVMIAAELEPQVPYRGATVPWASRCLKCNRDVAPTYSAVRVGGGCRFCTTRGINYTAPGIVYLMHHPEMFVLKVGVSTTTAKQVRIGAHSKTGWVTIGTWNTPTGDDAEQIEQQILSWWRDELGAPVALTKTEMRNGFSETAALIHVDIDDTINRIERLIAELLSV